MNLRLANPAVLDSGRSPEGLVAISNVGMEPSILGIQTI